MNVNNQYSTNEMNDTTKGSERAKNKKDRRINSKELKDGIIGLKNNSLYCYMNACL